MTKTTRRSETCPSICTRSSTTCTCTLECTQEWSPLAPECLRTVSSILGSMAMLRIQPTTCPMARVTRVSLNMVARRLATTKAVLRTVTRAILLLLIAIRMTTPAWACKEGGISNVMCIHFVVKSLPRPTRVRSD